MADNYPPLQFYSVFVYLRAAVPKKIKIANIY